MARVRALFTGALIALILVLAACSAQAQDVPLPASTAEEKPDYGAMAALLENEESRNRLIAELKALSDEVEEDEAAAGEGLDISLEAPTELAGKARGIVETVSGEFADAAGAMEAIDFSERTGTLEDFGRAVLKVGIAALVAVLIYTLVHKLFDSVCARASEWVAQGSGRARVLRHLAGALVPLLTALISIALAWISAYGLALLALSPEGEIAWEVRAFLNAFVIVEVARVLLEGLFSPSHPALRLLPLRTPSARYWNRWLGWIIGFVGYGVLVASPVVDETLSPALGQVLWLTVVLASYLVIVGLVVGNRRRVRARLQVVARGAGMGMTRTLLGLLARIWHILAILYFTALVLVAINDPDEGLRAMAQATLQTLLAVGLGGLLSSTLTRLIGRRITLSGSLSRWSPLLERQLNQYLPAWMKVIRVVITLIVIAIVVDAWTGFDLGEWAESETGAWLLGSATTVAIIVTVAVMLWIFAASWIERRLTTEGPLTATRARERTLLALFRNALAIAILVVTGMVVLSELGINIAPLLAGAGVLGLAIGFGAQKLVQDIITGIFIQLENAINTGDVVTVAGYSGEAEKITIRSLGLRDLSGTYHLIPFSSVDTVSNFMRGFSFHLGEYGIAYREDTDEALVHMKAAFEELRADPEQSPFILDDLEVHGVTALGDSAVTLRVRIKTLPGKQWGVGREYNRLVKRHFDAAGIEIPYPHMTLYFGQDKDGSAPPAPVQVLNQKGAAPKPENGNSKEEPANGEGEAD